MYLQLCRKRDYVSSLANPFSAPYGTKQLGTAVANVSTPRHSTAVTPESYPAAEKRKSRADALQQPSFNHDHVHEQVSFLKVFVFGAEN